MSITMKSLGIDQLSVKERLRLVEEIWDSIMANPEQVPLTEAQAAKLDWRLANYEADPGAGSTWDEVKVRRSARELVNTRKKLQMLEARLQELDAEPVANPRTRELTRRSLKKLANQLTEEIARFEHGG